MAARYLTDNPSRAIDSLIEELQPDKVLVVTDENVEKIVLPGLADSNVVTESPVISVIPGEDGKTLDTVVRIWEKLEEIQATRRSVVINIGGGVVTDIGGFAAATYKRGIRSVNFPTTLLGAVDAATGGKTGINFRGLKNEIGSFHLPSRVIVSAVPFASLPDEEILSGYAEMVKTALISDADFYFRLLEMNHILEDNKQLGEAVDKCVGIKEDVVSQDPCEKGLRKILNFGHTAGHAFESIRLAGAHPVSHGRAVAHGMLVALILSHIKLGFPSVEVSRYAGFLKEYYGGSLIRCDQLDSVIDKIAHDKKNPSYGVTAFTLLKEIGVPETDCRVSKEELIESLDLYLTLS